MTIIETDVTQAMTGDPKAYTRVVEQSATTVSAVAYAIVRNVQASEDVAQEAFLTAWRDLGKLRNPSSFLPWLRQITRNQAHSWLRDHRREIANENLLARALDPRPLQDDALLDNEQRRIVNEVLDALPEQTREVLVLFYREGSSISHVADLLGLSDDAVKQRLSRARAVLREETLQRFGVTLAKTAPGAVFVTAVAAAVGGAAPPASAAITFGAASKTGSMTVAGVKFVSLGALAGIFGIWRSVSYLQPYFDGREESELKRFRAVAAIMIVLTCAGFAVLPPALVLLTYDALTIYLCWFWLPRILARRLAWEREVNPAIAAVHRRQQVWGAIGQTLGAMIGAGAVATFVMRVFR